MNDMPMLAAVQYSGGAEYDLLLARVAEQAAAQGLRLAGVVQINETYDALCACDMTLRDLTTGREIGISQRLGKHSRGCRLDPAALEEAVGLAASGLAAGADALILNKFGKMEASGRGFRPLIGEAIERGAAVLVGINEANIEAWQAFAGDDAPMLPADEGTILRWLTEAARPVRLSA